MWKSIVSFHDHCLCFYIEYAIFGVLEEMMHVCLHFKNKFRLASGVFFQNKLLISNILESDKHDNSYVHVT